MTCDTGVFIMDRGGWREPRQSHHPLVQEVNPQRKLLINIQFVQVRSKCFQFRSYCTFGEYPVEPCGSISTNRTTRKQVHCLRCATIIISIHPTCSWIYVRQYVELVVSLKFILLWVQSSWVLWFSSFHQWEGSFDCWMTANMLNGCISGLND